MIWRLRLTFYWFAYQNHKLKLFEFFNNFNELKMLEVGGEKSFGLKLLFHLKGWNVMFLWNFQLKLIYQVDLTWWVAHVLGTGTELASKSWCISIRICKESCIFQGTEGIQGIFTLIWGLGIFWLWEEKLKRYCVS